VLKDVEETRKRDGRSCDAVWFGSDRFARVGLAALDATRRFGLRRLGWESGVVPKYMV